jgi:hypothetical protein
VDILVIELHQQVARLLGHPPPVRIGRDPARRTRPVASWMKNRCPHWGLDYPDALRAEDFVELAAEPAVAVTTGYSFSAIGTSNTS